ncbi:hypothetical protein AZ46_0218730 [Metabacillus indicus LMG 22858]|nr:hypothetical protein AZ46_0218730 [Metabacillus indicus LMG 22858]
MLRQSDKKSPEKSGFDFLGDFVLTEELGAAAGHRKPSLSIPEVITKNRMMQLRGKANGAPPVNWS